MANQYRRPPDCFVHEDLVFGLAERPVPWSILPEIFRPVWDIVDGRGVRIGIADTGVSEHPDLPVPVAAKNFTSNDPNAWNDQNGHGTHCAGIALGRNGIGVAPGAELAVARVLGSDGGGYSDWINAGIRFLGQNGCDIISLSIGGGSESQDDVNAIREAESNGVLIHCIAAGNSGYNGRDSIEWPGRCPLAACVGAFRKDGTISNFSSGGKEIDVAAPGEQIISCNYRGGWVAMSGTSMATPHFAGLCALVTGRRRQLGMRDLHGVGQYLDWFQKNGCLVDRGSIGFDPRFGNGILDIAKVIEKLKQPVW